MSQFRRRTQKSLSQPSTSRANHSNEFEDDIGSLTQAQNKSMSDEEHAQHVANVVKYILGANHTKSPILRANIIKGVNYQGKSFKSILESARKVLLEVFGYDLVEVDADKKSGKYILCNTIQNLHLHFEGPIRERYALLFIVLSHIFMNGEMCTQASLEGFLRQLGIITEDSVKNDIYGDVIDLIMGEFVKEKYISTKKSETTENEIELTWGERALQEVPIRSIMEFVSQVYEAEPDNWPTQYQRMLEMEREQQPKRNNTRAGGTQNLIENGMQE